MTISEAISQRQGQRAKRANRARQELAERRADEIADVAEIATEYGKVDRAGDVAIEGHFQSLYQLVDSKPEKDAVLAAYMVWVRSERNEDAAVASAVEAAKDTLRANNPYWLGEG